MAARAPAARGAVNGPFFSKLPDIAANAAG
jgi:hypothetical protein